MAKYTEKIKCFLEQHKNIFNTDSLFNEERICRSDAINNILTATKNAYSRQPNIQIVSSWKLQKLHNGKYPILYTLFKHLQQHNIIKKTHSNIETPDFNDFSDFYYWYDKNVKNIDMRKLRDIKNIILNETIDIYELIYNPKDNKRKHLHNSLYNNFFISLDIQCDIETSNLDVTNYSIDDKHHVHIYIPDNVKNKEKPNINIIAFIINVISNLSNMYDGRNRDTVVDLTVIFSGQKKLVNGNKDYLSAENINSGSTYPGRSIVCWRKEEFYKVLIHELIHYYRFDFWKGMSNYNILSQMINVGRTDGDDHINESYTESLAIIIMSIIMSCRFNNDTCRDIVSHFVSNMKMEINYLLFQLSKFIKFYGGDTFDDYISHNIVFNQTTSVRSYFVIKLFLLTNLHELLELMDESIFLDNERLVLFGALINHSKNVFIDKQYDVAINKLMTIEKNTKWIHKTSRMSVNTLSVLDKVFKV